MTSKKCFIMNMTSGTFTSSSEMLEPRKKFDGIVFGGSEDQVFFVAGGEKRYQIASNSHNTTEFVKPGRKSRPGPFLPYFVHTHCFKY